MESLIQIFSSEVMYALSWTIMHSIWQGLIIAIVLALFIKLTPRLRANTKYVISCIAMLLLFTLSAITFYSYYELEGTYAAFETVLSSNLNNTIQAISIENSRALFNAENLISNNSQIISLLWFFGLLFFFSRMIFGFLKIQRLKRDMLPLANAWNEILENLKAKANYTGNVFLGESTRVVTPLTFGVIKSVLLFPVGMITQLSPQEVEAILAHELAHIIRKDYLINCIQTLMECLYYFNPGVWIISGIIREQREHCCDDMAIALTGNRKNYLKALVAIEETRGQAFSLSMTFSGSKYPLLQRVQRILNEPIKNNNMKEILFISLLIIGGACFYSLKANARNVESNNQDCIELITEKNQHTSKNTNQTLTHNLDTFPTAKGTSHIAGIDEFDYNSSEVNIRVLDFGNKGNNEIVYEGKLLMDTTVHLSNEKIEDLQKGATGILNLFPEVDSKLMTIEQLDSLKQKPQYKNLLESKKEDANKWPVNRKDTLPTDDSSSDSHNPKENFKFNKIVIRELGNGNLQKEDLKKSIAEFIFENMNGPLSEEQKLLNEKYKFDTSITTEKGRIQKRLEERKRKIEEVKKSFDNDSQYSENEIDALIAEATSLYKEEIKLHKEYSQEFIENHRKQIEKFESTVEEESNKLDSEGRGLLSDFKEIKKNLRNEKKDIKNQIKNKKEQWRSIRKASSTNRDSIPGYDESAIDDIIRKAKEDMKIAMENINIDRFEIQREIEEDLRELSIDLKEDLKDLMEDKAELRREIEEEVRELHEELFEDLEDIKVDIFDLVDDASSETIGDIITLQLQEDNFITDSENYSFKIKSGKMSVNGTEQSDQVYKKYTALLNEHFGGTWTSQSRIKITRKGDNYISTISIRDEK